MKVYSMLARAYVDRPETVQKAVETPDDKLATVSQQLAELRAEVATLQAAVREAADVRAGAAQAMAEALKVRDAAVLEANTLKVTVAELEGKIKAAVLEVDTIRRRPEPKIVVQAPPAAVVKDNLPAILQAIKQQMQRPGEETKTVSVRITERDANGNISNFVIHKE